VEAARAFPDVTDITLPGERLAPARWRFRVVLNAKPHTLIVNNGVVTHALPTETP